ncbi:MAG: PDZ domain-containing protein [Planctomycetota bacterium]
MIWRGLFGRQVRAALVGVLSGLAPFAAAGQQPGEAADTMGRLIERLDSPRLSDRDSAEAELATSDAFRLHDLEDTLAERALSPEQRMRLLAAAAERFRRTPRAAIGISLDQSDLPTVLQTYAEFDSSQKLEVGDVILTIAGEPIERLQDLRRVIISHDPGATVEMAVERRGERVRRSVVLGSFAELPRAQIAGSELAGAWAFRLSRRLRKAEDPLRAPVDSAAWREEPDTSEYRRSDDRDVLLGGVAREQPGARVYFAVGVPMSGSRADRDQLFREAIGQHLAVLYQQLENKQRTIAVQQAQLKRRALDDTTRANIQGLIQANQRDNARLRAEMERYQRLGAVGG